MANKNKPSRDGIEKTTGITGKEGNLLFDTGNNVKKKIAASEWSIWTQWNTKVSWAIIDSRSTMMEEIIVKILPEKLVDFSSKA